MIASIVVRQFPFFYLVIERSIGQIRQVLISHNVILEEGSLICFILVKSQRYLRSQSRLKFCENSLSADIKAAGTEILKVLQLIASDKSNLPRKVHFLLKSVFQVIGFFVILKVGYLVKIVVRFVYK